MESEKLNNHVDHHDPDAWKQAPSVQIAEERAKDEEECLRDIRNEQKGIRKAIESMCISKEKAMYVQMKETDARNNVLIKQADARDHASSTRIVPQPGPRMIKNVEARMAAPTPPQSPTVPAPSLAPVRSGPSR